MNYAIDIIIVLIVLFSAILAAKKGFVKTLIEFAGFLLAVFVAFSFSNVAADYVYNNMIEPVAIESISTAIENAEDDILNSVPSYISFLAEKGGLTNESILNAGGTSSLEIATTISNNAIEPISINLLRFLASILIFVILLIVVKILAKFLNSLFKGVIFGTANKMLGAVLGAAKGFVYSVVFSLLCALLATLSNTYINEAVIESTFICKYILSALPFGF